jgi:Predicted outer membrane lipoprotein
MNAFFKASALVATAASIAVAVPATAMPAYDVHFDAPGEQTYQNSRHRYSQEDWRRGYRDDYRGGYRDNYRGDPVYRSTRTWRGDDGRYYCRKQNGTTGLIIGGAAGALLGREVDGGRDRTLGTVIGAAAGALLGREVDRGGSRCR